MLARAKEDAVTANKFLQQISRAIDRLFRSFFPPSSGSLTYFF
jgi:hypothetical protein